jgi:hypothetical protein
MIVKVAAIIQTAFKLTINQVKRQTSDVRGECTMKEAFLPGFTSDL